MLVTKMFFASNKIFETESGEGGEETPLFSCSLNDAEGFCQAFSKSAPTSALVKYGLDPDIVSNYVTRYVYDRLEDQVWWSSQNCSSPGDAVKIARHLWKNEVQNPILLSVFSSFLDQMSDHVTNSSLLLDLVKRKNNKTPYFNALSTFLSTFLRYLGLDYNDWKTLTIPNIHKSVDQSLMVASKYLLTLHNLHVFTYIGFSYQLFFKLETKSLQLMFDSLNKLIKSEGTNTSFSNSSMDHYALGCFTFNEFCANVENYYHNSQTNPQSKALQESFTLLYDYQVKLVKKSPSEVKFNPTLLGEQLTQIIFGAFTNVLLKSLDNNQLYNVFNNPLKTSSLKNKDIMSLPQFWILDLKQEIRKHRLNPENFIFESISHNQKEQIRLSGFLQNCLRAGVDDGNLSLKEFFPNSRLNDYSEVFHSYFGIFCQIVQHEFISFYLGYQKSERKSRVMGHGDNDINKLLNSWGTFLPRWKHFQQITGLNNLKSPYLQCINDNKSFLLYTSNYSFFVPFRIINLLIMVENLNKNAEDLDPNIYAAYWTILNNLFCSRKHEWLTDLKKQNILPYFSDEIQTNKDRWNKIQPPKLVIPERYQKIFGFSSVVLADLSEFLDITLFYSMRNKTVAFRNLSQPSGLFITKSLEQDDPNSKKKKKSTPPLQVLNRMAWKNILITCITHLSYSLSSNNPQSLFSDETNNTKILRLSLLSAKMLKQSYGSSKTKVSNVLSGWDFLVESNFIEDFFDLHPFVKIPATQKKFY